MDSEPAISAANAFLFILLIFGSIASYARPVRRVYEPDQVWEKWGMPLTSFLLFLWLVVILIIFAPYGGITLADLLVENGSENDQILSICATVIMQAGLIAIVLAAIHRRGWSFTAFFRHGGISWRTTFLHSAHLYLRYIPLVWLVAIFWAALLWVLQQLGTNIDPKPQTAAQWIADSHSTGFLITMGFMVVVAAPLSEELVFRGLLYRFIRERGPAKLALIVSSILFALVHASLQSFLPLCFIGLLLVKVYEDTKDIRIPIFFHAFFNLFSFLNLVFIP